MCGTGSVFEVESVEVRLKKYEREVCISGNGSRNGSVSMKSRVEVRVYGLAHSPVPFSLGQSCYSAITHGILQIITTANTR